MNNSQLESLLSRNAAPLQSQLNSTLIDSYYVHNERIVHTKYDLSSLSARKWKPGVLIIYNLPFHFIELLPTFGNHCHERAMGGWLIRKRMLKEMCGSASIHTRRPSSYHKKSVPGTSRESPCWYIYFQTTCNH